MIASPSEISNFVELFKTRHLSNAAIRLGITQPTLSQSLQRLERKVGSNLFIRTKRGLVPTDFGNAFYLRAKTLLDAWEGVAAGFRNDPNEVSGRFRVGCHSAVAAYAIPGLLRELNASAPKVELELVHDFSKKITERLISFDLHFAYIINPVRHPDLTLVKLGEDQVKFWKRKGVASPPKRLITDANFAQVHELIGKKRAKEFEGWSVTHTASLELVRALVSAGGGVGVLPERVAQEGDLYPLEVFDRTFPAHRDEIFLAYRREMIGTPSGKKVIEFARRAIDA